MKTDLSGPGVYILNVRPTGELYVGQASNLADRLTDHFNRIGNGSHANPRIQSRSVQHGVASFFWAILEECKADSLLSRERHWISLLKPALNVAIPEGVTGISEPWPVGVDPIPLSKVPSLCGSFRTKAFQFFLHPVPVQRFRAACALNNLDPSEALESLMGGFADKHGIPKEPGEATKPRNSPVPPRRKGK